MLVVDIDLWFLGSSLDVTNLVRIVIVNDGEGGIEYGNYRYVISHENTEYESIVLPSPHALYWSAHGEGDNAADWDTAYWKAGRIERFDRKKGSANLLGLVLKDAELTT